MTGSTAAMLTMQPLGIGPSPHAAVSPRTKPRTWFARRPSLYTTQPVLNVGGLIDAVFSIVAAFPADDNGQFMAEVQLQREPNIVPEGGAQITGRQRGCELSLSDIPTTG